MSKCRDRRKCLRVWGLLSSMAIIKESKRILSTSKFRTRIKIVSLWKIFICRTSRLNLAL